MGRGASVSAHRLPLGMLPEDQPQYRHIPKLGPAARTVMRRQYEDNHQGEELWPDTEPADSLVDRVWHMAKPTATWRRTQFIHIFPKQHENEGKQKRCDKKAGKKPHGGRQ